MLSFKEGIPSLFFLLISILIIPFTEGQSTACDSPCSDYNDILVGCNFYTDSASFNSCVCNNSNFAQANSKCVACSGSSSPAASFAKACKNVPPDCSYACNSFGLIISGCGDTSSAGFKKCVCSASYDIHSGAFNQAIQDCVNCENGGGYAASYEAYCCANGFGCGGISPQASAEAATMQPAASTTGPSPSPTTTSSKGAAAALVTGLGSGQVAMMLGQALALGVMQRG